MAFTQAFRESTTLKFVTPAWVILLFKFGVGGLDFGAGQFPVIDAGAFGIAFAAIIGVWLGREWRRSHYAKT